MVFEDDAGDAAPLPSLREAKKAIALARDADDGGSGGGSGERGGSGNDTDRKTST
jgi:hypothetical protein